MSVSPQVSTPCTPKESTKRQRSPTPPQITMVQGVTERGFRIRAELLCGPGPFVDSAVGLRKDIAEHLVGSFAEKLTRNDLSFKETVQLVNTLFEVAAAVAVLAVVAEEQQAKLDCLHQHAIEGLDLIGGDEEGDGDGLLIS